jgi:hypothetical protein
LNNDPPKSTASDDTASELHPSRPALQKH